MAALAFVMSMHLLPLENFLIVSGEDHAWAVIPADFQSWRFGIDRCGKIFFGLILASSYKRGGDTTGVDAFQTIFVT
ncbi:hypothetical protein AC579_9547 [Pseudocercospora musae]|uniref:Uncharacterized protein n=1 Tax=Pseudocercospora musae TaxID=113226 RepID=A0A139HDZ1_9PEZI|nr:hypothetical protein AC579_9547 [Pseudocercospora musae]